MPVRSVRNFLLILSLFSPSSVWAWVNADFETGTLAGWTVTTNVGTASVVVPGAAPNTNGTICVAPAICLDQVHSGGYAAKVYSSLGLSGHGDWARIEQSDTVPAGTPWISFWFAAVLSGVHYLANAPYGEDAYVLVEIIVSGTTIYSQRFSWYDNLGLLVDDGVGTWRHLPWTQYYYDMSPYVGQTATIRYTAYDCNQSGHDCYGFIDDAEWLATSAVPTMTNTATNSPTLSATPTRTSTPTPTPTLTCTNTPTNTTTITFTSTPSNTATNTPTPTCEVHVWPDPYNPALAVGNTLRINCMFANTKVDIFTISGELVQTLDTSNACVVPSMWGMVYCWNGRNKANYPVATGLYFYVVREGNKVIQRGKFLVVNTS